MATHSPRPLFHVEQIGLAGTQKPQTNWLCAVEASAPTRAGPANIKRST